MNHQDLPFLLGLVRQWHFGAVRLAKLHKHFPTFREAFLASRAALCAAGIEPHVVEAFLTNRAHIDPPREEHLLHYHGLNVITLWDAEYPPLLKTIYDPPAVLFCKGTLPHPDAYHLAVVGARKATHYGEEVVRQLVPPLARAGIVIVSGMAYGVDANAHAETVKAGGTTIAVLGGGLDRDSIYPRTHRVLMDRILESGGAVLSEFPIGTPCQPAHFPFRNRVISGLSRGTLVVECVTERSGTMITAKAALEQNRDVFAVPGPITSPYSEGPHKLIKMGAIPTTGAQDILDAWNLEWKEEPKPAYVPETKMQTALYHLLSPVPKHIDDLTRETQQSAREISATLTLMELNGGARHVGGGNYVRG